MKRPPAGRSWRRWCGSGAALVLAAGGLAASLFLAETGLRLAYFGPTGVLAWSRFSPRHLGDSPFVRRESTGAGPFQLLPGTEGYLKGVAFSVNVWGMRDVDVMLRKPPEVFRIAVLGDSFTMGAGVRLEQTYPKRLEAALNAGAAQQRYEVLNFAVGGQLFSDEVAGVDRVLTFSPDLILVGFVDGNSLPFRKSASLHPGTGAFQWARRLARGLPDSFLAALAWETVRRGFLHLPTVDIDWETFRRDLSRLAAAARRARAEVLIVILQDMRLPDFPWSAAVRTELAMAGVPFLETAPMFKTRTLSRYWIYFSDAHPNAEAHRLYAEAILAGWRAGNEKAALSSH